MYRNQRKTGEWGEYKVAEFEENKTFLLIKDDNKSHIRYTFTSIDPETTELEFYVWVEHDDLSLPFAQQWLNNLKRELES